MKKLSNSEYGSPRSADQAGIIHTFPLLLIIATVGIISFLLISSTFPLGGLFGTLNPKPLSRAASALPSPFPNCPGPYSGVVPQGQAKPDPRFPNGYDPVTRTGGLEAEPLGPIWCFPLTQTPPTRITGTNDWIDDFDTGVQMGRLNDGDMNYRIFLDGDGSDVFHGQMFVNANHWMIDLAMLPQVGGNVRPAGAVILSPNRSFHQENGKIVVETDVAWSNDALGGADNFVEVDLSPAAAPNAGRDYYQYGRFAEGAVGCRLQQEGGNLSVVCSQYNPYAVLPIPFDNTEYYPGAPCAAKTNPSGTGYNCLGNADARPDSNGAGNGNRIWESQGEGCNWLGGCWALPDAQRRQFARTCNTGQMDYFCRDRIRLEFSKTKIDIFVNGTKTHSFGPFPAVMPASSTTCSMGLPRCDGTIRDAILNNAHVFFTHWINDSDSFAGTTRTHWDRIAVNPHNPGRTDFQPPSMAPSYCPGQPQNTCPIITQITADTGINVPAQNTVEILDFVFNQPETTVVQGQTLTFVNKGTQPHSATARDGSWDTGILNPGQSRTITFNIPGASDFYCIPHPTMTGSIKVFPNNGGPLPPPPPPGSPSPSPSPVTQGTTFNLTMNGTSNVPVISTGGTGSGSLILSTAQTAATLTMSYSGLTSTANAAHIHGPAAPNQNASILFPLNFGSGTSGSNLRTTITGITGAQAADLMAGRWYVNVHSANFPNGEIRGTLLRPGQTPPPNAVPTASPTPQPPPPPPPPPPPGGLTVTFNDLPASALQRGLQGEYPSGVIQWGTDVHDLDFFASQPWQSFTTNSFGFNGSTITSGTFTLVTPRILIALDAYNGGTAPTTVTLSCAGNTTRQINLSAGQILTNVTTGWSTACSSITMTSTNGWNTNFDNLVLSATGATPPPQSCSRGPLGDIDCNGAIDLFDYNLIVTNFGRTGTGIQGDIDKDGDVDLFDYNILVGNFGT